MQCHFDAAPPSGILSNIEHTTHTQRVSHTRAVTCAPLETATPKSSGARKFNRLHIFAQNCRGLKTDSRLTELVHTAQWRKAFAICLSETWRGQTEEFISDPSGYTFLGAGQEQTSNRGSKGVGILLSPDATRAWHRVAEQKRPNIINDLGARVMAVTLNLDSDNNGRAVDVFVVSSYAPTSTHSEVEWEAYYDALSAALARRPPNAIVIIGADTNASIGRGKFNDITGHAK